MRARTPKDVIDEILARRKAGELRKAIAIDLDLSFDIVAKFTMHLPEEIPKREAQRVAVLAALREGADVREAATRAGVNVSRVVRILTSMRADPDASLLA